MTTVNNCQTAVNLQNPFEIEHFSDEMVEKVSAHLTSACDVVSFGRANKRVHQILSGNHIWKSHLLKDFPYCFAQNQEKEVNFSSLYRNFLTIQENIKKSKYIESESSICQNENLKPVDDLVRVLYRRTPKGHLEPIHIPNPYDSYIHLSDNRFFVVGRHVRVFRNGPGQGLQGLKVATSLLIEIRDAQTRALLDTIKTDYDLSERDRGDKRIDCLCAQGDFLFVGDQSKVIMLNLKNKNFRVLCNLAPDKIQSLRIQGAFLFLCGQNWIGRMNLQLNQLFGWRTTELISGLEIFENYLIIFTRMFSGTIVNICDFNAKLIKNYAIKPIQSIFQMRNGFFLANPLDREKVRILDFNDVMKQVHSS